VAKTSTKPAIGKRQPRAERLANDNPAPASAAIVISHWNGSFTWLAVYPAPYTAP
jgi:hypothetical protein